MRTLICTLPDGETAEKRTERPYTHVVAVLFPASRLHSQPYWLASRWTQKEQIGIAEVRYWRKRGWEAQLVAVTEKVKPSRARKGERQHKAPAGERIPLDRCQQCGRPRSRDYMLCQYCRKGKETINASQV